MIKHTIIATDSILFSCFQICLKIIITFNQSEISGVTQKSIVCENINNISKSWSNIRIVEAMCVLCQEQQCAVCHSFVDCQLSVAEQHCVLQCLHLVIHPDCEWCKSYAALPMQQIFCRPFLVYREVFHQICQGTGIWTWAPRSNAQLCCEFLHVPGCRRALTELMELKLVSLAMAPVGIPNHLHKINRLRKLIKAPYKLHHHHHHRFKSFVFMLSTGRTVYPNWEFLLWRA
jgi:hypothetical protein